MKKLIALMMISGVLFAGNATSLIEQNGCLECHQTRGAKMAPGWMGISKRADSTDVLVNAIKNGSSGKYPNPKFKDAPMPSYAHVSDGDIKIMAQWIYGVSRN